MDRIKGVSAPVLDHLGNRYSSRSEMCSKYGISAGMFRNRMRQGWSLEDTLTLPNQLTLNMNNDERFNVVNGCVCDHLGNPYRSLRSMCRCWHVPMSTFYEHLMNDDSLEECLTAVRHVDKPDVDESVVWVYGKPYSSYSAVDKAFDCALGQCYKHRDNIEDYLNGKELYVVDSKTFRTMAEIAVAYNMSEVCIQQRVYSYGWTLEDAVHTPIKQKSGHRKVCQDHLGNEYDSMLEMTQAYGISYTTYKGRLNIGWSVEKALTTPIARYDRGSKVTC